MEDKKKTLIFGSVAAVICVIAIIATYKTYKSDSRFEGLDGQKLFVKCTNQSCGNEYETDKVEFYQALEKLGPMAQGIKCSKCNQMTASAAIKCPKCKAVFVERSAGATDYPDRCPKCKFSETENLSTPAKK